MRLLQVSNNRKSVFIQLSFPNENIDALWDFGDIEPAGWKGSKKCVQVWNTGGIDIDKLNEVLNETKN